ncbi:MAG TPA: translocation/assembly module TamB domain-containing protein [Bryobacteraceae bacterium]|nr:translocation/assembly module TamB domain-containing protein [Bryobacteraceae bacterium]
MRRLVRIALWAFAALAGLLVLAMIAAIITVRTDWFRDKVHDRIVYEIEKATGTRVELGAFAFQWRTLTAEVSNLVLHGKEGANEAPLFRTDRAQVTLRILSLIRTKVDLYSAVVERPQANIIVYPDGSTNLPTPKRVSERSKGTVQTVLDLAIKHFSLTNGTVQFGLRRMPLHVLGENLRAEIVYDTSAASIPAPRYRGDVSFRQLGVKPGERDRLPFDVNAKFALARDVVEITSLHVGLHGSTLDVSGRVESFNAPRAEVQYAAHLLMADLSPVLGSRIVPTAGAVDVGGVATFSGTDAYRLAGELKGSGLVIEPRRGLRFSNIRVDSDLVMTPDKIELTGLTVRGLGGRMDGRFELAHFRDLRLDGDVRGFSIHEITHFPGVPHADWNGSVSGPVRLSAAIRKDKPTDVTVSGQFAITPVPGPRPVEGRVDLRYDRRKGVEFGDSYVATGASRVQFSGTLGSTLGVSLESANLKDFEPAIALVRGKPYELPVMLHPNGTAKFAGTVTGPLSSPVIQGRGALTNFAYEGYTAESLTSDIAVSNSGVRAQNIDIRKGAMHAAGWVQVGLKDWKPEDAEPLSGVLTLQAPELEMLAAELKQSIPITGGPVSADVTLAGTIGAPQASGRVSASRLVAYGEPLRSVQAQFRFSEGLLEVTQAAMQVAGSRIRFSGSYAYSQTNFRHGRLRFDVLGRGLRLSTSRTVQARSQGLGGLVDTQLAADVSIDAAGLHINTVNGWAALSGLIFEKQELGSVLFAADTIGAKTVITVNGQVAGAEVAGRTEWAFAGDYPVSGHLQFTSLNFATLLERFRNMPATQGLPFDGIVSGRIEFAGDTRKPETFKGTAELRELQVRPDRASMTARAAEQLTVNNAGPILVDFDAKTARVRQAVLRGRDTQLTVSGRITFTSRNPLDLRARGQVNLGLLRNFEPRLYSAGAMDLDVSVRGSTSRPDVYGRIDVRKAAFNWPGLPNGIDDANGVIFLYRDRATIDRITAETGGGRLVATGFVGFSPEITFHIETRAEGVRVRYPEGVSSSADATITLTGTVDRSLLAGDVTITRVGFNPRSDLGSILASSAQPIETPSSPNPFLQGMRLDIHIQTSPQVRLETKLTRDVQANADLRLRGDMIHPVLLGRVTVSQGEVLFFGNQYEIQTGQILFVNPSKIEPVVNLDLETRARGVEVTLHVSGPVNKLNLTFRSDPPLQSSDVVALLATGREPTGAGAIAGAQSPAQWQQAGASAILSQALANPIAGRLQRFFGVSRLKIDPQVAGLTTSNAAARVTLEQQITRNIALTYITDLSRPQAQTIRVELDLTRNWAAVAQREENGLFGIDFLYKKQFK